MKYISKLGLLNLIIGCLIIYFNVIFANLQNFLSFSGGMCFMYGVCDIIIEKMKARYEKIQGVIKNESN